MAVEHRSKKFFKNTHLLQIILVDQHDHNLQLFHLDVDRVVVLAKEDANLIGQDARLTLQNQNNVAKRNIPKRR